MNTTVSTHLTAIEAHIIRGRLEAEGVPAFVLYEHHIWMTWTLSVALGGVRVQVPALCFEKATEILTNIKTGKYQSELDEVMASSEPVQCPTCGSVKTELVDWPWKMALLAMFLFSLPVPYTQHLMKCETCAHTWIAQEQRGDPLSARILTFFALGILLVFVIALWCHLCSLYCEMPVCD